MSSDEMQRRFVALQEEGRDVVSITGGRFEGRAGSLLAHDGSMCVVELDDEGGRVRVTAAHVYKVLT